MRLCKKYLTYDHNFGCTNKGYLLQKHIQILWQWISFCVIPKKYSDTRTNFKLSHITLLIIVSPRKINLSMNNSGNIKKSNLEHLFKSYDLIFIKCIQKHESPQMVYSCFPQMEINLCQTPVIKSVCVTYTYRQWNISEKIIKILMRPCKMQLTYDHNFSWNN